ncbi:MAG TPA: DUF3078 domain-containing protein [Bacteroidota bacterium]|nr:DUF3078 domain-containing protein [Bacteroidota bacterium]
MKTLMLLSCILVTLATPLAQQKTQEEIDREKRFQDQAAKAVPDSVRGWKHQASTGANLTQVSFKDWVAGGSNALAYTLWLQGSSVLTSSATIWSNSYRLAFGQTRLADQGLRKTDDDIYLESLLIWRLGTTVNPYAAATIRTQFAPGYDYPAAEQVQVSKFFDPAYLTQSAGIALRPGPEFTTRLGAALREVVTSVYTQYATDPTTKQVHTVWTRGGLESVSDLAAPLGGNVKLVARLELFAPFNTMDRILVRNDYSIVATVNPYVTTNLTFNLIQDVNVSPRTQMKQALALGLTYSLL